MLDYTIKTADGNETKLGLEEVQKQLQTNGYQNAVIKPDGQGVEYTLNGQTYDDTVPEILKMLGHTVASVVPRDAEESFVQPGWRAALETLPDDEGVRKAYIKSKLKSAGHIASDDQIMGSGSDWYFLNPETNKWYATTNAKGFDAADLAGLAGQAPGFLGSVAGGALGAGAGVGLGSIPLGAAGAVAGDFAGRTAAQGIGSALDPELRQTIEERGLGNTALSNLKESAPSALGGAIGGVPGLSRALTQGFASRVAQPVGDGLGALGTVLRKSAGYAAESPMIKGVTTGLIPGLNTAQLAGFGLRAGELPVAASKGMGWLGGKISGLADDAIAKGGLSAEEGQFLNKIGDWGSKQQINSQMRMTAPGIQKTPFMQKIFGSPKTIAEKSQEIFSKSEVKNFYQNIGRKAGAPRDKFGTEAVRRAQNILDPIKKERFLELAQSRMSSVDPTKIGQIAGKTAQAASTAGRTLESAAEGVTGLGFRGLQGVGFGAEVGGKTLSRGARFVQPAENRMTLQGASNAIYNETPSIADMMKERKKQGLFNK